MNRRSKILAACFTTSLAAVSGLGCGSESNGNSACDMFNAYVPTTSTPLSFATDIYPIFADTSPANAGCAQTLICHGQPSMSLDPAMTKKLTFLFGTSAAPTMDPAMAKAELLMNSVNAPSMARVAPGSVKNSFLAYKIAKDRNGLACANSMCQAGASVGNNMPCGDLMPTVGTLSDTNRTKILDWIAQGASD
jgi:hypothetical protein